MTLVDGLPVITIERTISDLVEAVGDLSLVADALRDAADRRTLDLQRLCALLTPLTSRYGLIKGDGAALMDQLLEIAGIDATAATRRNAADVELGPLVVARQRTSIS